MWGALIVAALPLAGYALARFGRLLPPPDEWSRRGMNHGPWHYTLPGTFVVLGMLLAAALVPGALALGALSWSRTRAGRTLLMAAVIAGAAFVLFQVYGHLIFWVVD